MIDARPRAYKVSEITQAIKDSLEAQFGAVVVEGEISNLRPSAAGHYYFTLKDKDSVLQAVLFRGRASRLNFEPSDGQLVLASGSISVYPPRGSYQIICESLSLSGEGEILRMLEERKRKLAAEGLFDSEHKKPIPVYPSRIAVVTSPTGAAIRDILNVLERRQAAPNVVILPASVQGAEAPAQIAAQIQRADRYGLGEVILVGRGGGSLEDLLAFSDEGVVRAVYAAHTPVISCVGHEIDWALSDYVADLRAPTPSAAAELVSARRDDLLAHTGELRRQLVEGMQRRIEAVRVSLRQFSPENLQRSVRYLLDPLMLRLDDLKENLVVRMERYVADRKHTVALAASQIESRSPFDVLKRGYAIVRRDSDGGILRGPAEVSIGEAIRAELAEGSLRAKIIDSKSSDS